MRRFQFLSGRTRRLADNGKCRSTIIARERHWKRRASCFDSRQSRKLRQNLLEKLSMFLRLRIFRSRQNELTHERVGSFEAWLCGAQIREALDQQAGAGKKQ